MNKLLSIYASNPNSQGAKELANSLGIKRLKHSNSKYKADWYKTIINWGASTLPAFTEGSNILNLPGKIAITHNKLSYFQHTDQVRFPSWTTDVAEVQDWLSNGYKVIARQSLTGSSGYGIIVLEGEDAIIPHCPLYTRYVKKRDEYRLHYFRGKLIHTQRKVVRHDFNGTPNYVVRNHGNGFIYAHGLALGEIPEDVRAQGDLAFELSGLDFGALDIIYNQQQDRAYVLEINSAPGLTGTTLTKYKEAIEEYNNAV